MAYENFKPLVFSEAINRDLERFLVFAEDCNRKYQGEVTEQGQRVKILGVGHVTISTVTMANRNADMAAAETIEDTSIFLDINQIRTYRYTIGAIDAQFAIPGIEEALQKETAQGLGNEVDTYIAKLAQSADAVKIQSASTVLTATAGAWTSGYVLGIIDQGIQKLWENDVPHNEELVLTVTPRFYMIFKQAYTALDTNNSAMIENGRVGKYGNVTVKVSNNVATLSDAGATDLCMLRTKRAIAYVHPLTKSEAYVPEAKLPETEAIKGFILFDAKIVRPKELIVLNVKYS